MAKLAQFVDVHRRAMLARTRRGRYSGWSRASAKMERREDDAIWLPVTTGQRLGRLQAE
jgi:hypothetical protein